MAQGGHSTERRHGSRFATWAIWAYALGYFACYVPYSALTKVLTRGLLPGMHRPLQGFELLGPSVAAGTVGMGLFLWFSGWWRAAGRRRLGPWRIPFPRRVTLLSGLCTAGIIGTTTLAYTFEGVSIVFVMLLMRGGVLVLAPLVDALGGRRTRWYSWAGLVLSLGALLAAFAERGGYDITLLCTLDIALYLSCYFLRFRFMSAKAKSEDPEVNRRYFVEEQMVASPALLAVLCLLAPLPLPTPFDAIGRGLRHIWETPWWPEVLLVGLLSQGTGIFGSLVFLDARENTYSVPVNRSASILAGVTASYALHRLFGSPPPSAHQLLGAALVVGAILLLSLPPLLQRHAPR